MHFCKLLSCVHRQGINNIACCMSYFKYCGCHVAMLNWSLLIVVRVPVLFNKCSVQPCFPPVRIVLPAVLCCSGSALSNVHLHHLSLTGRHAMCSLIDVWICLRRGDRLSHGSVRQNMCEQKWGHLGRMRNCEDKKEEKKKKKDGMICSCFRRIRVPCVCCVFI